MKHWKTRALAVLAVVGTCFYAVAALRRTEIHHFEPDSLAGGYVQEFAQFQKAPVFNDLSPDGSVKIEAANPYPQSLTTCFDIALVPAKGRRKRIMKVSGDSSMGVSYGWAKDSKALFIYGHAAIDCRSPLKPVSMIYTLKDGNLWEVILK